MDVTVVWNFDVYQGTINPVFQKTGTWYDYFSGDSISVANTTDNLTLKGGEYHLYTTVRLPKPLFTGIDENTLPGTQKTSRALVFPNPTPGMLRIVSDYQVQVLELFDLAGHSLQSWKESNKADLSGLGPGLYLLKIIYSDQFTEMVKVSKL